MRLNDNITAENSHFLNTMVEQAMTWVDMYNKRPLLVPLTCWIEPPKTKQVSRSIINDYCSLKRTSHTIIIKEHILFKNSENFILTI